MTESPLVSVVLGTYNGEAYLEEQLRSVQAQTWESLEIIAIDDGSTDRTADILREYAARDARIRVIINESNLGFIRNFEKGARLSTGKWIAFCDQDDYWLPEKVEKMVLAIGDYPMIYCDSELCGPDLRPVGKKISDVVHYQSFDDCRQLCVFSRMYGHATLITRTLFERASPFVEEMPHDGWLAFHATLYGGVKYLPEALVHYRQHANNVYGAVGRKKKQDGASSLPAGERPAGAAKIPARKGKKRLERIRFRMKAYYAACPESLAPQKALLLALMESYQSFSPVNDIRRVYLFLANYKYLLVVKRYSTFRKYLFCLKMLVMIK